MMRQPVQSDASGAGIVVAVVASSETYFATVVCIQAHWPYCHRLSKALGLRPVDEGEVDYLGFPHTSHAFTSPKTRNSQGPKPKTCTSFLAISFSLALHTWPRSCHPSP